MRTMVCGEQLGTELRRTAWSHHEEKGDAEWMPNESISQWPVETAKGSTEPLVHQMQKSH